MSFAHADYTLGIFLGFIGHHIDRLSIGETVIAYKVRSPSRQMHQLKLRTMLTQYQRFLLGVTIRTPLGWGLLALPSVCYLFESSLQGGLDR